MVNDFVLKVTTTSGAGASAGTPTTDVPVRGYIEAIQIVYTTQPATTDVTIAEVGGMARTYLTITSANTNTVKYPRVQVHDTAGTALTLDGTRASTTRFINPGEKVRVTVAEGDDATNAVVVRLYV